jgi:hypothetical protein
MFSSFFRTSGRVFAPHVLVQQMKALKCMDFP